MLTRHTRALKAIRGEGSSEAVADVLRGHSAAEKADAINSVAGPTSPLGRVCAVCDSPQQQETLRLLLAEGGDPNLPAHSPVTCYPLTSTHSVPTLRQLVDAGAQLDLHSVVAMLRGGHPSLDRGGREMRRYLEEIGVQLYSPMSEH